MRAIVIVRHGGPEVLELRDVPEPDAGPGQLLVANEAIGVNYRDIYEREGLGPYGAGEPPLVAGAEGAGTILALGDAVDGFAVGEQVAWTAAPGSYAERVAVTAAGAVKLPDGLSCENAAAVLLQGMTAHYLATSTYPVAAGDSVLIHAVAGGVGLLLTQLVKARGGHVIGTTSSEAKAELARAAGADHVIGYEGFAERVRELTGGEGVAAVYDSVAAATFEDSLKALRRRGTLALFGSSSGTVPPYDVERLRFGSLFVTRPSLGDYTATRDELDARAGDVFGWVRDGTLQVRIGARYPLERAANAQRALESRTTTGKLLLIP